MKGRVSWLDTSESCHYGERQRVEKTEDGPGAAGSNSVASSRCKNWPSVDVTPQLIDDDGGPTAHIPWYIDYSEGCILQN